MARRKVVISKPHPHRFRVTHQRSYQYVAGSKATEITPGKKECITWRCYVHVPATVEGKIVVKRLAVYGSTADECQMKAFNLLQLSPHVLKENMNHLALDLPPVSAKDVAYVHKMFESGEFSLAPAIEKAKLDSLPRIRQLAEKAIQRKLRHGKNVVAYRANLSKLDLRVNLGEGTFQLGKLRIDEVNQSHLTAWIEMVASLVNRRTGKVLAEHTVEQAIAMVKIAWKELIHEAPQRIYSPALNFSDLGDLYRGRAPRRIDRPLLEVEKLLRVADEAKSPREAGVMALLLLGLRMNEVGAVGWEDVELDETGRLWVEPFRSVSASSRQLRDQTKVGWRENRTIPVCSYQNELLDLAKEGNKILVCGFPPCSTSDVSKIFAQLSDRANVNWEPGEHCKFVRHSVLSAVSQHVKGNVAEEWGHGKHRDTTLARSYDLREVKEKRKAARENLFVNGKCACDLLPWANRKIPPRGD
jgi:integrase